MLQRGVLQVGKAKEEEKDDHQGAITHNEEKPTSHTHIRILTEHFTDEYTDSSNMPLGKQPFSHSTNQLMNQILSIRWLGRHPATTLLLLITALIIAAAYHSVDKGRVALWSQQEPEGSWRFDGSVAAHFWLVYEISWSPDSTHFATVGQDNKIQVWSVSSKTLLNTSTTSDPDANYGGGFLFYALQALGWSPDSNYVLAGDNAGQIWLWMIG